MLMAKSKNRKYVYSRTLARCVECSYLLIKYNISMTWLTDGDKIVYKTPKDILNDIRRVHPDFIYGNEIDIDKY